MASNGTDKRVDTQFVSFRAFLIGCKRQNCVPALIGVGTVSKIVFCHTSCTRVFHTHPTV